MIQRGCPPRSMENLLAQLISKNVVLVKAAQMRKETITKKPSDAFTIILKVALSQQLMASNEWISSPMGELWLSELTRVRYTHVSNLTDGIRKRRNIFPKLRKLI
jgi:hypothetical protein